MTTNSGTPDTSASAAASTPAGDSVKLSAVQVPAPAPAPTKADSAAAAAIPSLLPTTPIAPVGAPVLNAATPAPSAAPVAPVAPVSPVAPVAPVAPAAPVLNAAPLAPTAPARPSAPPVTPAAPAAPEVDDNIWVQTFFARGNQFYVESTHDARVTPYVGKVMLAIMANEGEGVLAQVSQLESEEPAKLVFIPFDENTAFIAVPRGIYKYSLANAASPVFDIGTGKTTGLTDFFPGFVDDLERMRAESAARFQSAPQAGAAAVQQAVQDFSPQFAANTIFTVASSTNPVMQPFLGRIFKSLGATAAGVMAVGDQNSGVTAAVFMPFDGTTEFTLNPAGTFYFPNGVAQDQQVYNVQTQTYVYYEEVYPAYVPVPYVYYDPFYVPLGVVAAVALTEAIFDPWYYPSFGYYDPYYYW